MIRNEEELDRLTGEIIKKSGTSEPSGIFTDRVMQSVISMPVTARKSARFPYYWFLVAATVFIAGGWYLSAIPEIKNSFLKYFDSSLVFFRTVYRFIAGIFNGIESISLSPLILIICLAAFSLLLLDILLPWKKSRY